MTKKKTKPKKKKKNIHTWLKDSLNGRKILDVSVDTEGIVHLTLSGGKVFHLEGGWITYDSTRTYYIQGDGYEAKHFLDVGGYKYDG